MCTQKRNFWRERKFVAVTKDDIRPFDIEAIARSIVKQGHVDAEKQMNELKLQQAQAVTESIKTSVKAAVYKSYNEITKSGTSESWFHEKYEFLASLVSWLYS